MEHITDDLNELFRKHYPGITPAPVILNLSIRCHVCGQSTQVNVGYNKLGGTTYVFQTNGYALYPQPTTGVYCRNSPCVGWLSLPSMFI